MKIQWTMRALMTGWLLACAASVQAADRPDLYQDAENAELLVVRITAPNTEGAGIIFYVDDQYVYGITAKHVVFQQGKVIEGLQAELRSWAGRHLPVEAFKLHYQEDLAVFRAELAPAGLSRAEVAKVVRFEQLGASGDLDPKDELYSVGHSTASAWISPKAPLHFAKRDDTNANAFLFESGCPQGHSGGAVFDGQWRLVGMMIEEERPYCRALRIDPILKIVQGWKLEVSLRPPLPQDRDKPASKDITVAVVDFDNRSGRNLPNLGSMAQDITATALFTVPGITLVSRDRLKTVLQEHKLPGSVKSTEEATQVGRLLKADVLVTGSIMRYEVERRTFTGYDTSALQDTSLMAITLQILDATSGEIKFSKTFDIEKTKQYPKAASAPAEPIDLTSELLKGLLGMAQADMRSAMTQLANGLQRAGQFVQVPVTTKPAGADIILNGAYIGSTPRTLQLSLDQMQEIRLELAGYESWSRRMKVEVGMTIDVNLLPR